MDKAQSSQAARQAEPAKTMKKAMKIIGGVIIAILTIDYFCFWAWALSGQHPTDNFFFGTITAHALELFN